jgi:serine/threonine protein kinase
MVDDALTFKLGDLGTAKRLDGTANMLTTFAGTPVYMAPEVVRCDRYNEKSDIWSLGHLLYELCTQELLFNPSTLLSLRHKVRTPL